MRAILLSLLLPLLLVLGCTTVDKADFHPYRICLRNLHGGRILLRAGTVIAHEFIEPEFGKPKPVLWYVVQLDEHPKDGKHHLRVRSVVQGCAAAALIPGWEATSNGPQPIQPRTNE